MLRFRANMTAAAHRYLVEIVEDPAWAKWASQMAAIGAVMAWLDAGQPDPDLVANRIRRSAEGVIDAARST